MLPHKATLILTNRSSSKMIDILSMDMSHLDLGLDDTTRDVIFESNQEDRTRLLRCHTVVSG